MITAFESLRVRHPGLCQQLETLLGKPLDSFGSWRDVYSAISSRDLIGRVAEIGCASSERVLLAAVMTRCDYARQADKMLEGSAMDRISYLDKDQLRIFHEILVH